MKTTQAQFDLNNISAKHENDISRILRPWFSFRVFFKFKKANVNRRTGARQDTIHRYGFENKCSYKQCLHGHVDHILLDKQRGWQHVLQMVEVQFAGAYTKAIIYTRSDVPDGPFDVALREYNNKGGIINTDDELIQQLTAPENNQKLYYLVKDGGLLEITTEPVPSPKDFKDLVNKKLS